MQNETLGHRGRKSDPLYRCRRLLTKAKERLDDKDHERLTDLLRAGDPQGDVATLWQAKEAARALCTRRSRPRPRVGHPATTSWTRTRDRGPRAPTNPALLEALDCRPAPAHVSNGPTEAIKNFIKRVARAAFGFMSFRDYPIFFPGAPVPAFPRGIPPTPRRCAAETHQPQSPRKRPVILRDRGGGALAETWW